MNNPAHPSHSKRFWARLIGISLADGAAAMAAYAFIYGYLRWPDMTDESLPFGGLEFLVAVVLIAEANLFFLSWLYGLRMHVAPWLRRGFKLNLNVTAVGVLSLHIGGLGTVHLIHSLTNGVSIFDRAAGYFIALFLTVFVIVFVTAPGIIRGENKLRTASGGNPSGPLRTK